MKDHEKGCENQKKQAETNFLRKEKGIKRKEFSHSKSNKILINTTVIWLEQVVRCGDIAQYLKGSWKFY
jgi:hypothetical protein